MTVNEAVARYDKLYPNAVSYKHKVGMLSRLDKRVFDDVYSKYEDAPVSEFHEYIPGASDNTELQIPFPYDELYTRFLAAEIDLINGDIARFNNSSTVFNHDYEAFCAMYNRTHRYISRIKTGDIV